MLGIDSAALRIGIDVQEQLGGVHDLGDRAEGMPSPDDREERDRVQDEQEGPRDPEEVFPE